MSRRDVIVLGAGIVGTSTALHLARRGASVALVDRASPGEATSYGNAGVIDGAAGYPTPFPRSVAKLLRVALKRTPEANYHLTALAKLAPWLWGYFEASSPARLKETARALRPLMGRAVAEHEALLADAGALGYLRKDGWVFLYRSHRSFHAAAQRLDLLRELGVRATVLDAAGALALEAHLSPVFERAVHWPDVATVSNPLAVTQAYVSRFQQLGGSLHRGDALSLSQAGRLWRVAVADGSLEAPDVVVALGPWTPELLKLLGLRLPFGVQRGYHRHYRARGNAGLSRPVVDIEYGYVLAPMEQGIRLTTGAEFALHGAPPTPVQFGRLLSEAHRLFPLGEPVEATPWLGARPCLSDMRPVIGRAPRHRGIWLNFGHNHFGLTLGPVTGRLLAEMIDGTQPFCDAAPFAAERFLR